VRFVADESCDHAVVRALRKAGHSVDAVSESFPGAEDAVVMERARRTGAVVITEDTDFGRLVFADRKASHGVMLLRFPASTRGSLGETVAKVVREHAGRLADHFVVVEPGKVRIGGID
jgi:predicted nuclease of predicted toxin-antitoxin system